ncbi:MAG TPA: L,D-transpeptidase [Solirubrobacterales bacterium]|nr:L,D-transpeptidase [Solirubrobacterales bacterium]
MNRVWTGVWIIALAALGVAFGWFAIAHRDEQAASDPATAAVQEEPPADAPKVASFPGQGYEVAQVREGEKVEVFDHPGGDVVTRLGSSTDFGSPRVLPVIHPGKQWLGVADPKLGNGAVGWVRYDPEKLTLGDTRFSLRIDLSARTLELRRDDDVLRKVTVSVGRLGNETPTGRFAVTDTIVEGLDPVYGSGAVALSARQDSLPPGWVGGDLIAIHGWAGPVGAAESGGCLRASNEDVEALIEQLPLGAPVFISN